MKRHLARIIVPAALLAALLIVGGAAGKAWAGEEPPSSPPKGEPEKAAPPPEAKGGEEKTPPPPPKKEEGKAKPPPGKPGKEEAPKPPGKEPKKPAEEGKEEKKPGPAPAKEAKPRERPAKKEKPLTPEEKKMRGLRSSLLISPLEGGRNSFFHSLIFLPPVRAGFVLAPGSGEASVSFEFSFNKDSVGGGNRVDATHFEAAFNLSYSLTKMVEFHGNFCGSLFAGDVDLDWRGTAMVPSDRKERFRISRLVLGTKFNLLPLGNNAPDLWVALDFKIQATDKDLADSGRPGVALSFLASHEIGPLWVHLNIGWSLSDGQEAFPSVVNPSTDRAESIRVDRVFFWGLSLVLPVAETAAITLQGQGHTNGFKDVSMLNSDIHVIALGARYIHKAYFAEVAGGPGLSGSSLDFFARLEIGMLF